MPLASDISASIKGKCSARRITEIIKNLQTDRPLFGDDAVDSDWAALRLKARRKGALRGEVYEIRIQLNFLCSLGDTMPFGIPGSPPFGHWEPVDALMSECNGVSSMSGTASSLLLQRSSPRATAAAFNRVLV